MAFRFDPFKAKIAVLLSLDGDYLVMDAAVNIGSRDDAIDLITIF